jgi:hypothetical protein
MTDHRKILQSAEEASKVVQDPDLRKIAFQEIVRNEPQKADARQPASGKKVAPDLAKSKTPRTKSPRTRSQSKITRAVGTREEVRNLDISPDEKELPSWSSISQDWIKFCWILEAARRKKVDGLTSPEISYLVDHIFRENYNPAQVNNLKKKIKGGFVRVVKLTVGDRSVDAWKILSGGIAQLKKPTSSAATK